MNFQSVIPTLILALLALACDPKEESSSRGSNSTEVVPRAPNERAQPLKADRDHPTASSSSDAKDPRSPPVDGRSTADDSRLEAIGKRYTEVTGNESLKVSTSSFECRGGEVSVTLTRFFDEKEMARAAIQVAFAGHASEKYEFLYDEEELVFAIQNDGTWHFSSDAAEGQTTDRITQRRYYFEDGHAFRCLQKKVEGPTKQVDHLLSKEPNAEVDCGEDETLLQLAKGMRAEEGELIQRVLCKG